MNHKPIRGRIYASARRRDNRGVWYRMWTYEVLVGHDVILTDNCRDYDRTVSDCLLGVAGLRRIYGAGYRLTETWADLMRRTPCP